MIEFIVLVLMVLFAASFGVAITFFSKALAKIELDIAGASERVSLIEGQIEKHLFEATRSGTFGAREVVRYRVRDIFDDDYRAETRSYCDEREISIINNDFDDIVKKVAAMEMKSLSERVLSNAERETRAINEKIHGIESTLRDNIEKIEILDNIDAVAKFFYGNKDKEVKND